MIEMSISFCHSVWEDFSYRLLQERSVGALWICCTLWISDWKYYWSQLAMKLNKFSFRASPYACLVDQVGFEVSPRKIMFLRKGSKHTPHWNWFKGWQHVPRNATLGRAMFQFFPIFHLMYQPRSPTRTSKRAHGYPAILNLCFFLRHWQSWGHTGHTVNVTSRCFQWSVNVWESKQKLKPDHRTT